MAQTKAASLKRARIEDTCTGHEQTFKLDPTVGYGCSKDVALNKLLGVLMAFAYINRKYDCANNS